MICSHKCVSIAGTKDAEIMVGETKRRSNTEKKDVAFLKALIFIMSKRICISTILQSTKKGRALISNVVFRNVNNTPFYANL